MSEFQLHYTLCKDISVYRVHQEDGKVHDKTLHMIQLLPFTCLPTETLLDAPPDSVILHSNHVSSEPPLDTNSDSS